MKIVNPCLNVCIILILLSVFSSCKKEVTRWETDWSIPFVTDTLSFYNFHNDSTLDNLTSSDYLVVFERELLDISLNDFFFIPDTTISQTFSPTIGIGSVPPGFTFYNEVEAHELSVPDVQLKKIIVSSGQIDLKVFNPIGTSAYYTLQMPGVVKDGSTLEHTFFINAGTTEIPAVANEQIILDGYAIDLRGEDITGSVNVSGFNILQTSLSIMSDPNGEAVPITTSDVFEVEAKIKNLSIDYAQGYFGEQVFSDTSTFNIPILNQIVSGNIDLDEVPIDVEITNGTKIPFSTEISILENTNSFNNTISLNSALIGNPQLISPATGAWSTLTPSNHLIGLDNSNSNMTNYIENLGHTHSLGFEVKMNPFGAATGSFNEIFPNSELRIKLKSEFPLGLESNGLVIVDTVQVNLSSDIVENLIEAKEVTLHIKAVNSFPISGNLSLQFLDNGGSVLHDINDIETIQSSLLGFMDNEENLMKNESVIEVFLNHEILNDFDLIKNVVLVAEFNTAPGIIQSIPSNAYLFFKSNLKVKTLNSIP
ncbi:hypothetical protein OAL39_02000 [bacterium]|nr:hypothetical protein [bacterium]